MENQRIESHGDERKHDTSEIREKIVSLARRERWQEEGDWAGRTNQGFLALSRGARARFLLGDDDDDDDESADERRG